MLIHFQNARVFSADSYWACYSPVMNPVAHLAWLGFLLHIPGRCQGPHRRQRSLPKSQPCYTDECVCPVLWSRLSASVCLCVRLCVCMFSLCACSLSFSLPLCASPPQCLSPCVLLVMWLHLKMRLEMNAQGKVKLASFVCRYSFLGCIFLCAGWATWWSQ